MQVMKEFVDLQEHSESIGSQCDSQDDSGGNDVSQKTSSDDDDIFTLIDKVAGNIIVIIVIGCDARANCKYLG